METIMAEPMTLEEWKQEKRQLAKAYLDNRLYSQSDYDAYVVRAENPPQWFRDQFGVRR